MNTNITIPDVRLISPRMKAQGFYAEADDPSARFALLKEVCEQHAQDRETVLFHGVHMGGVLDMLDIRRLARFGGYGRHVSRLHTTCQHDHVGDESKPDKPDGCAIMLGSDVVVENCTLSNMPDNWRQDGALLGPEVRGTPKITIRNCALHGQDWTFYHWGQRGEGATVLIEDTDVQFARQGITQAGNAASESRWTLSRVRFFGYGDGSRSRGATSGLDPEKGGGLFGVVFRCGTLDMLDCEFVKMVGAKTAYSAEPAFGTPRIACITDQFSSIANKSTVIRHRGTRFCEIVPGEAEVVKYVDVRYGRVEEWRQGRWLLGEQSR